MLVKVCAWVASVTTTMTAVVMVVAASHGYFVTGSTSSLVVGLVMAGALGSMGVLAWTVGRLAEELELVKDAIE